MSESVPTEVSADKPKTYHGSCHCGFIRYEIDLIVSSETISKCNCSYCHKSNFVLIKPKPSESNFKLISPASLDEIDGNYLFASKYATFHHCKNCGIQTFISAPMPDGQMIYCPNVVTLDDCDLSQIPCKRYWDCKGKTVEEFKLGEKPGPGGVA